VQTSGGIGGPVTLTWRRCKGGKQMSDTLDTRIGRALLDWLAAFYGSALTTLKPDAPIWVSLSCDRSGRPLASYGASLSPDGITYICRQRLGTGHVHALRHTFARAMERSGATTSETQRKLGHTSLDTTGRYLSALNSAENPLAAALADLFEG
jgi:integrase